LFVANDGSPLGFIRGLEFLEVARGGEAFGAAIGGHALLIAAPCSVDGGADEIGGATDWPFALPSSQTPAHSRLRAKSIALLIRVLQTVSVEKLIARHSEPRCLENIRHPHGDQKLTEMGSRGNHAFSAPQLLCHTFVG
jgi:hypothetical protein